MNLAEAKRRLQSALAAAQPQAVERSPADEILTIIPPPAGHPDEESCRQIATDLVAWSIGAENPEKPHYPTAIATALAERYGIDMVKYAVNERHAEILRRSV